MGERWTTNVACLLLGFGVGSPVNAQDVTEVTEGDDGWCRSVEVWRQSDPDAALPPEAGGCPLQGACDDPAVRNQWDPGAGVLTTHVRLNFVVFKEDDGSNPAASEEEIEFQIAQLQSHFAPYGIAFETRWRYKSDSRYRDLGSDFILVKDMKDEYAFFPEFYCNIYVTDFTSSFAVFPWDPAALTSFGGIVIDEDRFAMEHKVLTHEVGHALGLWHTHHGVSEVEECGPCYERADGVDADLTGDFCGDTPPTPANFGQCNDAAGDDPCSGAAWGDTMPESYMSYGTFDGTTCWSQFTRQQVARMHCWVNDALVGWQPCGNGVDCNGNGVPDDCDIADRTSGDADGDGIPDECDLCPGDLDGDGEITINDILLLLLEWGVCQPPCEEGCLADLDDDCNINVQDLLLILGSIDGCG